jgi:hypothetical protein
MEMMNELSRVGGWICEHRDTNIDFSSAWPKGRGFDLLWGGGMRICLGRCTTEDQLD